MLLKSTLVFTLASVGCVSALPNLFAEKRGDGPGHPGGCNGVAATRKKLLTDNQAKPIDIAVTIQERYAHLLMSLLPPLVSIFGESYPANVRSRGNSGAVQWIATMLSATFILTER